MNVVLPLSEMSTADKLSVMETLWNELCREPEMVPSPEWHREVLSAREQSLQEGRTQFSDFEEARDRLRKAVQ
jgi:hypothetical protein